MVCKVWIFHQLADGKALRLIEEINAQLWTEAAKVCVCVCVTVSSPSGGWRQASVWAW